MTTTVRKAALVYDFDGTLARGNLQERSFIPAIGMTREAFWQEVKGLTRREDADEILVYMQLMLRKAAECKIQVTKEELRAHGRDVPLFEGLADGSWFDRLNDFAARRGLELEHYIISSGIHEMIAGCPIFSRFKMVFASRYIYGDDGVARWPGLAINYTTKTQYLFRINKGIPNSWDNERSNIWTPEEERPIPFARMIFLGDGDTDIPTMKMMTHQGGNSIAVFDPEATLRDRQKIHRLISENRVNFVAAARYSEGSQLDIIVQGILGRIARSHGYRGDGA
jgi:phosphoserine phosphatase